MISVIYLYLKGDAEINFGNNPDADIADMRFHWIDLNKDGSIIFDEFSFQFKLDRKIHNILQMASEHIIYCMHHAIEI